MTDLKRHMSWARGPYIRLMIGLTAVSLGLGAYSLGVATYLVDRTGQTSWYFAVVFIMGAGQLITLPFSAGLMRQIDPYRVYVATLWLRVAVTAIVAATVFLNGSPIILLVLTAFFAANDGMQRSALFASIHTYLPLAQERSMVSKFGVIVQGGAIAGTGLYGLATNWASVGWAVAVDPIVVMLAAIVIGGYVPRRVDGGPYPISAEQRSIRARWRSWASDLRKLKEFPYFALLLILCSGDFVYSYALLGTIPALVDDRFGGSPLWSSAFATTYAAFIIIGSAVGRFRTGSRWLLVFTGLEVAAAVGLVFASNAYGAAALFAVAGFANVYCITALSLSVQEAVTPRDKPRASALRLFAIAAGQVLITPALILSGRISLPVVYVTLAAVMTTLFIGSFIWLRHRATTQSEAYVLSAS